MGLEPFPPKMPETLNPKPEPLFAWSGIPASLAQCSCRARQRQSLGVLEVQCLSQTPCCSHAQLLSSSLGDGLVLFQTAWTYPVVLTHHRKRSPTTVSWCCPSKGAGPTCAHLSRRSSGSCPEASCELTGPLSTAARPAAAPARNTCLLLGSFPALP